MYTYKKNIGGNDFCREVALKALTFGHVELDVRWALTAAVFPGAFEVSQKVFISIDVMLE